MPQFGSDPQLIGINSNLHSLTERVKSIESLVMGFNRSLNTIIEKLDAQAQMLESLGAKQPPANAD